MPKILLVDDERLVRDPLSRALKAQNYEVECACDGEEALELLGKSNFDVIVTDIILPRLSGMDLLKKIRQNRPAARVILITGNPSMDSAAEAVRAGAFDYLVKPFKLKQLTDCVASALLVKNLDEENSQYRRVLEASAERREMELFLSEEKFRRAFEESPIGIGIFGADGFVFDANSAFLEIMGVSRFAYISKMNIFNDIHISEEGRQRLDDDKSIKLKIHYDFEKAIQINKLRTTRSDSANLDVFITPISKSEGGRNYLVHLQDVTERTRMQVSLKDSEERFRALFESAAVGILMLNLGGRIFMCNNAAAQIFACESGELLGRDFFELVHPEDLQLEERQLKEIVSGRMEHFQTEIRCLGRDGAAVWTRQNVSLLKDFKGMPKFVVSMIENIEQHKQAEQELEHMTANLQDRIREMNCLYAISSLSEKNAEALEDVLKQVVELIPMGWNNPEVVYARLKIDGNQMLTPGFKETVWKQESAIVIDRKKAGSVEIYLDLEKEGGIPSENIKAGKGLLNAIAERVARIVEARRIRQSLEYRLKLEKLVSSISTQFISMSEQQTDEGIIDTLGEICRLFEAERGFVWLLKEQGKVAGGTHEWLNDGAPSLIGQGRKVQTEDFKWWRTKLAKEGFLHIPRIKDLPPEAMNEQKLLFEHGVRSILSVAMLYDGRIVGFIGVSSLTREMSWPDEDITILKTISGIFTAALGRKMAFDA